ncbi:mitogen-activated protein kinase kinase kinase 3-like [Lineus longissimus]|uniref:mitogen-activated protein kinase kinase kinase 3-like n=1 Tax=Lineus longissimus TaxID=88925 RepID=UPI00315C8920
MKDEQVVMESAADAAYKGEDPPARLEIHIRRLKAKYNADGYLIISLAHNILLGSNDRIKLIDFGIAKELSTSLLSHGATTAGAGKHNYLSPEAATGYRIDENTKGYGLKTDIWSTGCVVLEMTTGKRPWNEHDPRTVLYPIGNGNTPPIADDVPSDVKAFLALTFIVDPAKRPSAEDLLKDKLLAGITSDDSGKAGTSSADRGNADTTKERKFSDFKRKEDGFLGRGAYGTVWSYQDMKTDETIAIKEIDAVGSLRTKEGEALLNTVKIMREISQYKHQHIVQYYFEHNDEATDKWYIGMEYLTGGSLTKKIAGQPLTEYKLRRYTYQILCGIQFLHGKHLAHRDIKCK